MKVLIVESNPDLGNLWKAHVQRIGCEQVELTCTHETAIHAIIRQQWDVIVLNLVLDDGGAMSVSDYASFRQPNAKVIIINSSSFFSDGSIFNHIANAQAVLPTSTHPEDLAAMVAHYGEV